MHLHPWGYRQDTHTAKHILLNTVTHNITHGYVERLTRAPETVDTPMTLDTRKTLDTRIDADSGTRRAEFRPQYSRQGTWVSRIDKIVGLFCKRAL